MVKGVSRQVIVVKSPEPKLFEQAIFILRDDAPAEGITDDMLLREAKTAIKMPQGTPRLCCGPVWACAGAAGTALLWLLTLLI